MYAGPLSPTSKARTRMHSFSREGARTRSELARTSRPRTAAMRGACITLATGSGPRSCQESLVAVSGTEVLNARTFGVDRDRA